MSIAILEQYFPDLSDEQKGKFEQMIKLYQDWNEKINVISRKDMDEFVERHILHSLSIAKYLPMKEGWYVVDLGTGGGFPGIPLAILYPNVQFVLVDSIGKKIKVVEAVKNDLKLDNVRAIWGRVENVDVKANLVVTRAVAPLSQLVTWTKKILKPQSKGIIALKGGELSEELKGFKRNTKVTPLPEIYKNESFFETKVIVHYKPSSI
ncbi:MAG: 16S rRNA (guanine(527)-N(7))-methyltransferase RsmG [Chitinophagales bacterium]|nr:16S rRNA (guanine(527)-N(7))-methyltransferase RsmG [Chitinophagales bacterium]MCZ2394367.1 16S rRNA (guanine(527)-N(7))-methyltransferase RsmG [Chitinophagales bacterium]